MQVFKNIVKFFKDNFSLELREKKKNEEKLQETGISKEAFERGLKNMEETFERSKRRRNIRQKANKKT
jgi:hypothetical protein